MNPGQNQLFPQINFFPKKLFFPQKIISARQKYFFSPKKNRIFFQNNFFSPKNIFFSQKYLFPLKSKFYPRQQILGYIIRSKNIVDEQYQKKMIVII